MASDLAVSTNGGIVKLTGKTDSAGNVRRPLSSPAMCEASRVWIPVH
jgi:hypothetical protein